jgi:hypothetical protein
VPLLEWVTRCYISLSDNYFSFIFSWRAPSPTRGRVCILQCNDASSIWSSASLKLQNHLNAIQTWLHKWRMQANALRAVHVTFTTRTGTCPLVHMNNVQLPCVDQVKYLGLHLDRKLTWHHHIFTKRKQIGLSLTKMYWLLGAVRGYPLPNKLLLYKSILKPICNYGIQLWGTSSTSKVEILERFQSKALRIIVDAPWYVPNNHIRRDLQMTSVKEEICRYSSRNRRLRRHVPNDLLMLLLYL